MKYAAEIIVREDPDNIQKCLLPEKITRERSEVKAQKEGDELKITVSAKDATAFRATMNALTQIFAVYGKSKEI